MPWQQPWRCRVWSGIRCAGQVRVEFNEAKRLLTVYKRRRLIGCKWIVIGLMQMLDGRFDMLHCRGCPFVPGHLQGADCFADLIAGGRTILR